MTTRRVVLEGGAPWGFRMHGGKDQSQLLRISRVNPGSKAALRGVREGDLISSINGQSTKQLTNAEAHALLKQADDSLTLGLNEEIGGSPKRRQFRTVHQETLEQTVKRSSVTTYSLKKTVETEENQSDKSNENSISKRNERHVNGTSKYTPANYQVAAQKSPTSHSTSSESTSSTLVKEGDYKHSSTDNAEASQRSSYTNCTLSPSNTSIFSEDGTNSCSTTQHFNDQDLDNMNSNNTTKSKRRRQRRRNRRALNNSNSCDIVEAVENEENDDKEDKVVEPDDYIVNSPGEVAKTGKKPTKPVKSKSLDDDENVRIQELSEVSESEDKENQAIISEASESETEWEEATDLQTPKPFLGSSLSTLTVPLESFFTEEVVLISPEEEKNLRDFLEGLNLVNGPEEAARLVYDNNSSETIKQRKSRKRAALEQYFFPVCQNPRYLDVISEEASDRDSDKEQSSVVRHLKQGTPELELPPKVPPRPNREKRRLPAHFLTPVEQPEAILVDTKILDSPKVSQGFCSTTKTEQASNVEVVFLKDSSGSDSPEDVDPASSNEEISTDSVIQNETEIPANQPTNPELITYKNDTVVTNNETVEELGGANETLTTSSSTNYNFVLKCDKIAEDKQQSMIENGLLSELTPPPTPDNMSPKNATGSTNSLTDTFNSSSQTLPEKNEIPEIIYTNVVSPPPPPSRSSSSSRSSSRESSLCTAKYIPTASSFTDVALLEKEDESKFFQPMTLREICLQFLYTLPFGPEILQELADVSKTIESYTSSLPSTVLPKLVPNLAQFANKQKIEPTNDSCQLSVKNLPKEMAGGEVNPKEFTIPIKREEDEVVLGLTERKRMELLSKGETLGSEDVKEIVRQEEDLEKLLESTHIPTERKIPIVKDWVGEFDRRNEKVEHDKVVDVTKEGVDFFTKKNSEIKEHYIPITVNEMETAQHKTKKKEIEIPITKEWMKENSTMNEHYIPISKVTEAKVSKETEQQKTTAKEVKIPITKEWNDLPEPTNVAKETNIPITKNWIDNKFESAMKETNIPIYKEWDQPQKIIKEKETIIPITKSWEETSNVMDKLKELEIPLTSEWVGLQSENNPSLLACLSPKQKEQLEKTKKVKDETEKLIELHEKFVNRKLAQDDFKKEPDDKVTITSFNKNIIDASPSNRLLTMIQEEPTDESNFLYFVEKDPRKTRTLPRSISSDNNPRLRARNLHEWLQLARDKSMSESSLNTVPDIPENNLRNTFNTPAAPRERRTSLPQELFQKQMYYIQEKEREIQRQLEQLEEEKRKLSSDMAPSRQFHAEDYYYSRKGDFAESKLRPTSVPMIPTEIFRQQMYEEWMDKVSQMEDRKQNKVIKVTSAKDQEEEKSTAKEIIHPIQLEDEFMSKVKQKREEGKLETLKSVEKEGSLDKLAKSEDENPVLVMDGEKLKEAKKLPKHLQEFVDITKQSFDNPDSGIWSPGQKQEPSGREIDRRERTTQDESLPPVWTPKSASSSPTAERKEFRSVNFQSPVLTRKNRTLSETLGSESPSSAPPWRGAAPDYSSDTGIGSSFFDKRLTTSHSSPASGFGDFSSTPRLPRAQNPTITLLQKAREGHLPRGPTYIDLEPKQFKPKDNRPPIANPGEVRYQIKNEYTSDSEIDKPRRMANLGPRKFEGIGPVTKDGMPLILRSEVKDQNQSKWYKRMYDTIHKTKPHNDEYVTVRYKQKRAQYPYSSGYLSEPEPGAYDSDFSEYKYQTLDRRKPTMADYVTSTMPRSVNTKSSSSDVLRETPNYYTNQPGRIENYTPGHSSIAEKEAKQWWDEVMDIFDGHLEQQKRVPPAPPSHPKSFINQALKESGYESDSTLIFRKKEEATQQFSPKEHKEVYKVIQKGGDVPLQGLRKPAPERPKETELVEFYPVSPTLTRIRIHKTIKPQKEILCYPVTVHHNPENTFSAYKRTAPSLVSFTDIPTPPPIPPPSPPRRKSSRNNPTLRLVSTMKVKAEKSPICKRHETCFTTTSTIEKSKVNYLRDKISCKLSPTSGRRSTSPKMKVVKKITASPDLKNRITSTITTTKDSKTSARKVQSKTNIHTIPRSKSTDSVRSLSKLSSGSRRSGVNMSDESLHKKTFGTEKKRFDFQIPTTRIAKSPDLLSPTEVKKAVLTTSRTLPTGTIYKKSNAVLSSSKNSRTKEILPIKVGISEKARSLLRSSLPPSPKLPKRTSPSPSSTSERSRLTKSSLESLSSPKPTKKIIKSSSTSKIKSKDDKSTQKFKKEQINDEIVKKERNNGKTRKEKSSDKSKRCVGKAEGTEIVKKLSTFADPDEFGSSSTLNDIRKQREAMESNHFFQNLFLRDISPPPSAKILRNSWIIEKTNQLSRRRSSFSEPSIGAMKVYLKHIRPVSDSKFISLDMATSRSRSVSPKSVTFDAASKTTEATTTKRSSSLPPKLIFTETSRPVSPVVQHRKMVSPPPSPKLSRSPSSRKIMYLKEKKTPEYSLYMCPSLNHSTTSLDSLKSEDYHRYFTELVHATTRGERFKDLSQFYSGIEKVGELERAFSLKPRKRSESEIIDFDRWKEVRTRERAEHELDLLYHQIKAREKEKGFLFLPKDVNKFKWKKEYDRGLRIKEKSVDDIKEEFEKIKMEESERENARRRELAYLKDTYKPLWRGSSVANMANTMVERRSQSEGRVKTGRHKYLDAASERLLTHGIGSRIWSSLSMEQVNILKDQLAAIYNGDLKRPEQDFSIKVPKDTKSTYVPSLSVRRNSDSSEQIYKMPLPAQGSSDISEDEKKIISQTLSRELLEKLAKQRKENKIVVGKEILGAVASMDAKVKPSKTEELPKKPLVKTNALNNEKNITSPSENESGSTDESTKTVINLEQTDDIKKKVEYFEKAKELENYIPTVYKAAESSYDIGDIGSLSPKTDEDKDHDDRSEEQKIYQSKSCQSIKDYFGEKELVKFATIPLSATRKNKFSPKKPELRATEISPIRSEISINTSMDSLNRSRSSSPFPDMALVKSGEVRRLRHKFEWLEDVYGNRTLKRSRSESDLHKIYPSVSTGYVDHLRRIYEYPAHSGRGRSRTRRGGVVSPIFLKAEDRLMPHINIISKIASLYARKNRHERDRDRSMEELADILGCQVGEVEKMREKFDSSQDDISLVGHMYTSSPSIKELRDIAPYLTANWVAHRYPRYEDNTRSLSSPENSLSSRDTSLVRRDKLRPKSISPLPKIKKSSSILKPVHQQQQKKERRSTDFFENQKYDPKKHQPVARYQPIERYKNGWSVYPKPTVSFKEPEPPEPPPKGLHYRSLEPESPRKYVENEVTIHYKTPVRQEIKEYLSEDELAHRQAEAMKKIYQEERRRKYLQVSKSLQELQDMNSRRHTDNFIPSQKSPIPLNRYDDFDDLAPTVKPRPRSPEPRLVARALYNFVGQTARELTFRKGDLIYVRRQVDKNWYEGELNAMVGLFPVNYVEIVPYDGMKSTPRKSHEGQARAKYNFLAQTHLELSLAKGELVVVTRKVDDNWFEGKIGGRKGIFPASYVELLIDPQEAPPPQPSKPVASPAAHSLLLNGSAGGKESMGSHCYTPNLSSQLTSSYQPTKPLANVGGASSSASSYGSLQKKGATTPPIDQALHIETQSEPVAYRALYKYAPQNDDELELLEGDTVYVLEKCDDGWYVGSSNRTGAFGTFPGNYVEKI